MSYQCGNDMADWRLVSLYKYRYNDAANTALSPCVSALFNAGARNAASFVGEGGWSFFV